MTTKLVIVSSRDQLLFCPHKKWMFSFIRHAGNEPFTPSDRFIPCTTYIVTGPPGVNIKNKYTVIGYMIIAPPHVSVLYKSFLLAHLQSPRSRRCRSIKNYGYSFFLTSIKWVYHRLNAFKPETFFFDEILSNVLIFGTVTKK